MMSSANKPVSSGPSSKTLQVPGSAFRAWFLHPSRIAIPISHHKQQQISSYKMGKPIEWLVQKLEKCFKICRFTWKQQPLNLCSKQNTKNIKLKLLIEYTRFLLSLKTHEFRSLFIKLAKFAVFCTWECCLCVMHTYSHRPFIDLW